MLDANSKTSRAIVLVAVAGATLVHSSMNAVFGYSLGATEFEKYLFAGFGVCTDICKVFALAFLMHAWEKRHYLKSFCGLVVLAVTLTYSLAAATGFAALTRDTVVAGRSADADDYKQNVAEKKRLLSEMEAARANSYFQETFGCTQDLPGKGFHFNRAKQFCHMYWRASAKYDEIKPVVRAATLTQADPQVAIMASILSVSKEQANKILALFIAFVAEIVSSLGVFAYSRSMYKPTRAERKERLQHSRTQRPRLRMAVNNG